MHKGALTYKNVAETHNLFWDFIPAESIYEKVVKVV